MRDDDDELERLLERYSTLEDALEQDELALDELDELLDGDLEDKLDRLLELGDKHRELARKKAMRGAQ